MPFLISPVLSSGLPAIKGHITLLSCRQKDGKGLSVEGTILLWTRATSADTSIILQAVVVNSQQIRSTLHILRCVLPLRVKLLINFVLFHSITPVFFGKRQSLCVDSKQVEQIEAPITQMFFFFFFLCSICSSVALQENLFALRNSSPKSWNLGIYFCCSVLVVIFKLN